MKMKTYTLALVTSLGFLTSCANPAQNARLASIGGIAINYAEAKGAISKEDASFVRESKKILLDPVPSTAVPVVDRTSSK